MRLALILLAAFPLLAAPAGNVFIIRNSIRDMAEFRQLAAAAARLKPFGQVQVDIGLVADKAWHDMPEGGSPWHEFGSYNSATFKFFPHPEIAKHLPPAWVAANRKLLLDKAAVLRQHGLLAAFTSNDTNYLPEAFFREHPTLRGPRVDHPRRTPPEGDPNIVWTGAMVHDSYPVLGLFDIEQIAESLEKTASGGKTVILTVGQPWYFRGNESSATVQKLIEIVEAYCRKPFTGAVPRRQFVEAMAARWGGAANQAALTASSRFLTGPLLIRPESLLPQEEQYFLPHVFAVHESDARGNYQDAYETKLMGPPQWEYPILRAAFDEAIAAAESLEKLQGAPSRTGSATSPPLSACG